MQLHIGDRLTDETGEYEVIGRPYTTAAGKTANVSVKRVGSDITMIPVRARHGETGFRLRPECAVHVKSRRLTSDTGHPNYCHTYCHPIGRKRDFAGCLPSAVETRKAPRRGAFCWIY
jgi:hypothetical protein